MKRGLFLGLCLALAFVFGGLGVWQVERLQWKEALIARVEQRLAAPPIKPPSATSWMPEAAYTRVTIDGVFRHQDETLVQAVTDLGAGWWVMTPLQTDRGLILVNRGFVPTDRRAPSSRQDAQTTGPVHIVGLLRPSEPHGAFLRANAPGAGRWYSRDVAAIAAARHLPGPVMPYFIDADATANPGGLPVGGLTVVTFHNSHLLYALTWFTLCGMSILGMAMIVRGRWRR